MDTYVVPIWVGLNLMLIVIVGLLLLFFNVVNMQEKQANIQSSHMDAILNLTASKPFFHFLWNKYFKDVSKKRSGSGMLDSFSKRSRETSSLESFSYVNPNPNLYRQVMVRFRELFGNRPSKRLTKAYRDTFFF
jgi:hypothetical protein